MTKRTQEFLYGFQIRTHIKMFRCNRVNGCCIAWWSIFSFLICYYSSYVSPYYEIPVSCDPIIYHLMGRGMMEGLMPYRDLFDQKGPFIFLIYGFSYTLCGSYWLVFVLEVFAVTASMIFCYKAALLFVSGKKAFIVSLLILYSMCSFHYYAGGGHPSEFILPFQFAAIYGVCRLYRDPDRFVRTGVVFGAGIGMALLLKFNLAAFWFVPFLYVLYRARMTGKAWIFTGSVGGTLLLMLTPCLWYFYSRGALLDLYEGYIVFNAGYGADAVSFKEMCRNYSQWVKRDIMYPSMLMYIVGGAGVILSRMPAREKIYYTAAFLITCMGVQGNGKTHFNHYALTLIPFAAVGYLVVARMIHVEEVVSRKWRRWLFPLVVAGVMACTFLNCVDFSCRSRAREWMSAFALPDTSDEPGGENACAVLGRHAVWFYCVNGLVPPIRTFTICASDKQGAERERMRQYQEIRRGKIDYVVIAGEYFKPDNTESPSLRAMRDLLSTEYCRERSFFREVTNLDIYRRVKRD